jgi:hypothetical protein
MSQKKKAGMGVSDPAAALAQIERPAIKWKAVLQIVAALLIVWITSLILVPYAGYWAVGIAGVITVGLAGFGVYVWTMTRRSQSIVDIVKGASSESDRQKAIEKLAEGGEKDAMRALARAQLEAQSKPQEALQILEDIDLAKAPSMVQDDIRSQLALLYLRNNRVRDARDAAEQIRLDRQPNAQAKALYAAVIAESFARTGKVEDASKLMDTYSPDDPEYGHTRAFLLRAQVYTYFALKKRGLVRKAMTELAQVEPGLLSGFIQKGTQPELVKMAKQLLSGTPLMQRPKVKRMR